MRIAGLLAVAATMTAAGQTPGGAIEGVVMDAMTHGPVAKAVVTAWSMTPQPDRFRPGRPMTPAAARTEAGGTFALRDLPPGVYHVSVNHPRFPQFRGPVTKQVDVKPGETARAVFDLIPGASITGRIVDEDGDPLSGCWPQVLDARTGDFAGVMGSDASDASGAFSVWGIPGGKYKLMVRCGSQVLESYPLRPINSPPPPPTLAYPLVFYPGVPDLQQAQVLELGAGQERTGVDFQMKPVRIYTVSGVVRAAGDLDLSTVNLMMVPRSERGRQLHGAYGGSVDQKKRTFEFRSVFPGSYSVLAFIREEPRYGTRVEVEIPGAGPLELELRPGIDVSGKVEVEGEFKSPLSSINVQLVEVEPVGLGASVPKTAEDGSFTAGNLLPGLYRVSAMGPQVFVKSITWGGNELTDGVFDASAGGSGPLVIVLSTKTATLKGTAPPNTDVRAFEVSRTNRAFHAARVDAQGNFNISGLAPGTYRVTLGEAEDSPGEDVTLREDETATVDVRGR